MNKSKSSSSSETDQSQTTLTADGFVSGNVFNVKSDGSVDFQYIDQLPEDVASFVNKLVDFGSTALNLAVGASEKGLIATQSLAAQAAQPDLAIVKQQSSYIPWIIGGAAITLILILRKK